MNNPQSFAGSALVLLAQTTLLLFAVLLVSRQIRSRGPAATSLVYKAALVGIIALFAAPLIPLRVPRALHVAPPPKVTLFTAPQILPAPKLSASPKSLPSNQVAFDKAKPIDAAPASVEVNSPAANIEQRVAKATPITLSDALIGIWILGSSLLIAWLAFAQASLVLLRRSSRRVLDGFAVDRLNQMCRDRGLKTPELRLNPSIGGPFLVGIVRPAIILHPMAVDELDPSTLDLIFEHELAHLRSRDCLWRLVERVLCALIWPQPLLWNLCSRLDQCSEELCDQVVIANRSSRRQYADCLLSLAEGSRSGRAERTLGVGVVLFHSKIGQRIAKIMDTSQRVATRLSKASSLGIAGFTAVLAVATVMAVSGYKSNSYEENLGILFDKSSDPAALSLWREMRSAYHKLNTYSAVVHTSDGYQKQTSTFEYMRPGRAVYIETDDKTQRETKIVQINPRQIATVWPKNPKVYQLEPPAGGSTTPEDRGRLFNYWPMSPVGPMAIIGLLEDRPTPPTNWTGKLTLGPDRVVNGEKLSTLVLNDSSSGNDRTVRQVYFVGKSDYLLRQIEQIIPLDGVNRTFTTVENYQHVLTNPRIEDGQFKFLPAPGTTRVVSPSEPSNVGPGVRDLFDKVTAAYKNLKTLSFDMVSEPESLKVSTKKPNRARLSYIFNDKGESNEYALADGTNEYWWMGERPKLYFQTPASAGKIADFWVTGVSGVLESVSWALGYPPQLLNHGEIRLGPRGMVDGIAVDKIIVSCNEYDSSGNLTPSERVTVTYSFGKVDHLLHQVYSATFDRNGINGENIETVKNLEIDKEPKTDFKFHPGSMVRAKSREEFIPTHVRKTHTQ